MDLFEKVEKLVRQSGCRYEDAKAALEQSGGDLLEAMILLERQGKTAPQEGAYSTRYESQPQYVTVRSTAQGREGRRSGGQFKAFCQKAWHFLSTNFLIIKRQGEMMAKLPFWAALLILLGSWFLVLVLLIVSLFFGFTYSFEGEKEKKMQEANKVMDKIHRAAESAREEFKR